MTASLASSRIHSLTDSESTRGESAVVEYFVNVTEPTTPRQVRALARGATSPNDAVPVYGDSYNPGIDSQPAVLSLLASNFRTEQRESGPAGRLKWRITVTYEPQNASGQRPATQDHLPPVEREARRWTEQLVVNQPVTFAKNRDKIRWPFLNEVKGSSKEGEPKDRDEGTFGPITNAAGVASMSLSPEDRQKRFPIFVQKTYTLNPYAWIDVERTFGFSVNNDEWDVFGSGFKVKKGECRYLGIDTSRPLFWGNTLYYELETRVLWNPKGHDIIVPNWGSEFWEKVKNPVSPDDAGAATAKWTFNTSFPSGLPARHPLLLDLQGELLKDQTGVPLQLRFYDNEPKDYDDLNTKLKVA